MGKPIARRTRSQSEIFTDAGERIPPVRRRWGNRFDIPARFGKFASGSKFAFDSFIYGQFLHWRALSRPALPVLARRKAVEAAKHLGKVAGAVKAAGGGNLRNAEAGIGAQHLRPARDAVFEQVLHG